MRSIESKRWMGMRFARVLGPLFALAGLLGTAACADGVGSTDPNLVTPVSVLLTERVFAPGGARFYYVSVLPDVPGAAVDRSKALELTSADVEIFNERVYIRDRDANTMTRYRALADFTLREDGQFSFAGVGVGTGRYSNAYVSASRAYLLDSGGWRLIGWNPTTMVLTGEVISIDYMAKHDLPTGAISPPVKVGNRLVSAINWADFTNLIAYPGSGALVIDPASSAPPVFVEDARLGGAFRLSADDNGDAYMTGVLGGDVRLFGHALGGGALPASGLLRLPAGQSAFDPSYLVDVEAITQTKSVWAIHRIDATTVLAQIYDPAVAPPPTIAAYNASRDFIYVLIDTVAKTFTPVATLPRGGRGNSGNHVVDGKLYIQISYQNGSVAYAVSSTGVAEAFTVPSGDVWHLQRIR